jgi:hypothetical protein
MGQETAGGRGLKWYKNFEYMIIRELRAMEKLLNCHSFYTLDENFEYSSRRE